MPFRSLSASVSESALPGNAKPPGFEPRPGPRPGGATTWDWYIAFVDTNGKVMTGGTAKVQWYGVEVAAGAYTTPTIGGNPTTPALQINRKSFGAGLWPWCTVQATPPVVAAKVIEVTIAGAADGTYSIDLVGGAANPIATYAAAGDNNEDIAIGLAASFSSPGLSAVASFIPGILTVYADTGGVDFEIDLASPDDDMTQATTTPYGPAAAIVEIRTTASAAAEIDTSAIEAAVAGLDLEGGAAAAIAEACATGGQIRNVVRPDGGGAAFDYINGPDIGGGAARYEVVPAFSNKTSVQNIMVASDKPITWSLYSGTLIQLLGPIAADPAIDPQNYTPGPGAFRAWKTNQQEAVNLVVSDRTAAVRVTYYAVVTDDN